MSLSDRIQPLSQRKVQSCKPIQSGNFAQVARGLVNDIFWINGYPVVKCQKNKPCYPLDSDLPSGYHYPPLKQTGPED